MSNQDKPIYWHPLADVILGKPTPFKATMTACRAGKTESQSEAFRKEWNKMISQEAIKAGASYCTVTSDALGVHIKQHNAEDVLQDAVYGTSHVEHNEPLSPKQLDTIAERSAWLLEDSLRVGLGIENHERPIAASQAKDSEMSELLRNARGDYPSAHEQRAAQFMQARISEQASDLFMHGKPLTTMSEAEYNEIKISKASKDTTEKPQQVNKDVKDY